MFPRRQQVYAVQETKSGQVEIVTIPVGSPNNVMSIATLPGKGWALVTLFGGVSYIVEVTGNYEERSSRLFSIFYDAALKKPLRIRSEESIPPASA